MLNYAAGLVNIRVSYDGGGSHHARPSVSPFISPSKVPFHLSTVLFPPCSSVLCSIIVSCFFVTAGFSTLPYV